MLSQIGVFVLASAKLAHASHRNAVIAGNIANADTPGFRARDVAPFDFERLVRDAGAASDAKATRPGHAGQQTVAGWPAAKAVQAPSTDESPNANTVSIEEQMAQAAETRNTFELAATLYAENLALLRTALGRGNR